MTSRRERFIEKHRGLFWYTPEASKKRISDELLVETTLNDGTLEDFRELKSILTPKRIANVFFAATGRKSSNYYSREFYLVGDTAIALHIGHRRSIDFDFPSSRKASSGTCSACRRFCRSLR